MDQETSSPSKPSSKPQRVRIPGTLPTGADTPMVVVYDQTQDCPYLEDLTARMPLEHPIARLKPSGLDSLLARGYRRTGPFFYHTRCANCQACIPVRVDVGQFRMTSSMRRIANRAKRELDVRWGAPKADEARLNIFNSHRLQRDLARHGPSTMADYHEFLVATSVDTCEITFYRNDQLIGVAITDIAADSLNAVYTHFDPSHSKYSIGTLAILLQIEKAIQTRRQYVYLGLYVAENRHLNYKQRFLPQERLIDGEWMVIEAN
ncbi:arginyltransferase [Stieleria sp. JC731]|uniref:arginyltransferase n=1 Tax=Pirellulaceae TaxID=2691357 RepID=UPI001E3D2201|nr:arginyltransferase [Stieleria sp. JC731]MCC9601150.1 arginyltransferase [Stieleria sp. JC731]